MPSLASRQPRARPNAALARASKHLPSPASRPRGSWTGPLTPDDPNYLLDRDKRLQHLLSSMPGDILRLKLTNSSIRDLIRQHQSAWTSLRCLYNSVIILQKLLERLRDMFLHLPHVESVAKNVNIYEPEEQYDAKDRGGLDGASDAAAAQAQKQQRRQQGKKPASPAEATPPSMRVLPDKGSFLAPQQSPWVWSNRVLPRVEQTMLDLRTGIIELDNTCRAAVLRKQTKLMTDPDALPPRWDDNYVSHTIRKLSSYHHQLESHMLSCKFIHMVTTDSLYNKNDAHDAGDSDSYCYRASDIGSQDQPSFYAFWSGTDLATAAKMYRKKQKKKLQKKKDKEKTAFYLSHDTNASPAGRTETEMPAKGASNEEQPEAPPEAPASKEDLLAAIRLGDYLTVITMLMADMSLNDMLLDGTYLLSHALVDDNSALVSILAMCGAEANVRDRRGYTPLHIACFTNSLASAMLLLELGAFVNVRDTVGMTPLHVACRERSTSLVLQLLARGADPNACDDHGLTPLSYALMNPKKPVPSRDLLTVLLTYGARTTGRGLLLPSFFETILQYDATGMSHCLAMDPDLVHSEMLVATTGHVDGGVVRLRPLYAAILVGNIFAIDQLLRKGADVNHTTESFGKTTTYISLAVQAESVSMVSRLLLEHADPNMANSQGRTPLHLAAASARGNYEIMQLLLRHGADCLAATHDRHSQALHMAVRAGRADMCHLLLKNGAPIDRPLRSGITPVMLAIYHNNRTMMRFLMSQGADMTYTTPIYGETAMHTASRVGNTMIAAILLQNGLSVNATVPFPPPRQAASSSVTGSASSQPDAGACSSAGGQHDDADDARVNDAGGDVDSDADSHYTVDEDDRPTKTNAEHPRRKSTRQAAAACAAPAAEASALPAKATSHANRSVCGYAPIHAAASRGHVEMVRWLLANGADPEARIGRVAANVCLGKDRLKGKGKGPAKASSDGAAGRSSYSPDTGTVGDENKNNNNNNSDDDDESDLGLTPAMIARVFCRERMAALIEDHILESSPSITPYLTTTSPPPPPPS